jgi:predicted permease
VSAAANLRYAFRLFRASPGFSAVAVATLAIGIGVNASVFSLVRGALLKPASFAEPDRVVALWERNPKQGYDENPPSAPNFEDWRRATRSFERLALADAQRRVNLADGGRPERVAATAAEPELFPLLGVSAALGRTFDASEAEAGRDAVVLLSDSLWSSRFRRDPWIVGHDITVDGRSRTVVGVMPRGFAFPADAGAVGNAPPPPAPGLWIPLALSASERAQRSSHSLLAFGLLKPGVTPAAAAADLSAIQAEIERSHPSDYVGSEVEVIRVVDQAARPVRPVLVLLSAAVGFVLLVACANIAQLLIARGAARRREMAIRSALGAGRSRLVAQLWTESLLLAGAGALAGLAIAALAVPSLKPLLPAEFARPEAIRIDPVVLLFTLVLASLSAVLFGLVPAFGVATRGANLGDALAESSRGAVESRRSKRLRGILTVTQIALALMLAAGATLMSKSLVRLLRVAPGIDARGVETAEVTLPSSPYATRADRARFFRDVLARLASAPGVAAAGMTTQLPLSGENMNFAIEIEGRATRSSEFPSADLRAVSPGYFAALSIPLVRGRLFSPSDGADSPHVVVVNEALVRKYYPGLDPLGRRVVLGVNGFDARIVGVVRDVHQVSLETPAHEEAYVLYEQAPFWTTARLVARAAADGRAESLAPAIREAVAATDSRQAVAAIGPLDAVVARSVAQPRLRAGLVGLFGVIALALAALGLYGLLSWSVARRTREIGVRMALGARPGEVLRLVVGEGLVLAAAGVAAGLAGSLALSSLLARFLFGVGSADPGALGGAVALLLLVAVAASAIPAVRASRIDPMAALRSE